MNPPVGRLVSIWLPARLRMRRRVNMFASTVAKSRKRDTAVRAGTPGRRRTRWILMSVLTALFLLMAVNVSNQIVLNLHAAIDAPQEQADAVAKDTSAARMPRSVPVSPFSEALTRGLVLELALVLLATLCASLGTRELAHVD